jgi:hypothetical protein
LDKLIQECNGWVDDSVEAALLYGFGRDACATNFREENFDAGGLRKGEKRR